MRFLALLLLVAVAVSYCTALQNYNMYEISTRPWLYQLSQKYGRNLTRLQDIPDSELLALKQKGMDIIWFMGVWSLGQYGLNFDRTNPAGLANFAQVLPGYTVDDIIGSPYAVTEYSCNPELGSDSDILALKQKLNSMGLLLMLDFVPNHSAVDCPYTNTHPEYYVRAPKGTQPPYNSQVYLPSGIAYGGDLYDQWRDTAQFNYWNLDLRQVRIKEILHIASLSDAIRCDMAYYALNDLIEQNWSNQLTSWGYKRPQTEFWSDAIQAAKQQYPNVIFLAEVYNPYESALQNLGFDYTYDKVLYDKLAAGNLDDLRGWITQNSVNYITHSAHYISNHDEQRAAAYFGGWTRADAAGMVTFTLPGMRFYWMGLFQGYKAKLDVHLRRETYEPVHQPTQDFYDKFLSVVTTDVFNKGTWTYLTISNSANAWRLVGWRWELGNERVLCVVNYSDTQGSGSAVLSNAQPLNGNDTVPVTDLMTDTTYYRSVQQMKTSGLFVLIQPWSTQLFKY